jgi:hypothetical protein
MAIKAGDSELAAQVMREHIEDVEISLFSGRRKEESIEQTEKERKVKPLNRKKEEVCNG